ncbi:FAD/NAD(P)-binding protein [Winogradskyella sp.]|uniref:FAD/NAD(P)-binding protein n=1 Tax=Winogradskyella sp. TaxID=1883156 RepID=UPI00351584C1
MKQLAIIGQGPRGLYALEQLISNLSQSNTSVTILLIDFTNEFGTSYVWKTSQPESNWININERGLSGIEKRKKINYKNVEISEFPSYHDWCNYSLKSKQPDTFPPRSKLGRYLSQRYESLISKLEGFDNVKRSTAKVDAINLSGGKLIISSEEKKWFCDDVLLTIGHQPIVNSGQLEKWNLYSKNNPKVKVFDDSYPVEQFKKLKNKKEQSIGIRGFGLAMIDVMRYLTINNYGNFKVIDHNTFETVYYKTEPQKLRLIPFSLDGLPLAPKPLNKVIDDWYKPTSRELHYFKSSIEAVSKTSKKTSSIDFLLEPIVKIASRVFNTLKNVNNSKKLSPEETESIGLHWLNNPEYKHPLIQNNDIATYDIIKSFIEMALGNKEISLDYCIGQVWRHCQPALYSSFSHAQLDEDIIEQVIEKDERIKRYSYGPPIESMQQLLALVDAEILDLDFVQDPEIELTNEGFKLSNEDGKSAICSVMINSVLDSPKLLEVNSPIIKSLLNNQLIAPIHSKLGIETKENGYVVMPKNKKDVNIAVLGRLAKGSVIGVDAILECFGPRVENWAASYVKSL